ncbi:MAG: adenine deaminase [Chitinophagaceae bacterium]|nr:adenine deaminase [Chitinophagaceae bacterium]MCB9047745.1 adenine deaminase [Chitinophagales bacterium]
MSSFSIKGQLTDVFQRRIYPAEITITDGKISEIIEISNAPAQYIMPGFVDAHVHIESSMLVPAAFARLAVVHGTIATVSDPHEIANVCGPEGVQYMIDDSKRSPFKFFFGAPSCVPATFFETAGAHIDARATEELLTNPDIWYLAEMMNFPGVLHKDEEVMAKIAAAKKIGKPVDGHAPGLRGDDAAAYAAAGITTDHECFTIGEAQDKLKLGMKILIREGSAARNFEELVPLFATHADRLMFCSDDKHPDELVVSHINALVKRALAKGYELFDVLRAASVNPAEHYNIPVGLLRNGDAADFVVVDNLDDFNILQTYINGELVAENGKSKLEAVDIKPINNFNISHKKVSDFEMKATAVAPQIRVIEALDGQLVTNEILVTGKVVNGCLVSDVDNDILKMAVVNRYDDNAPVSTAFIKNIGIKAGALASTVAHDCHNIIAVGADDEALCKAVNALVDCRGGVAVVDKQGEVAVLPLPIAGLMADTDGYTVAERYSAIDKKAKALGSRLRAPYMTLSFMALLVIPALKLSDKGLFNGGKFEFTPVEV